FLINVFSSKEIHPPLLFQTQFSIPSQFKKKKAPNCRRTLPRCPPTFFLPGAFFFPRHPLSASIYIHTHEIKRLQTKASREGRNGLDIFSQFLPRTGADPLTSSLFITAALVNSKWDLLLKLRPWRSTHGSLAEKKPTVVFVLGGPGSGKGTQCANIVEHFGYTHLSAGDLLRAEIKSGSENGTMIQNMIKEGKIVPSEVTIKFLEKAILGIDNDKFLIDGFPRNEENRAAFEAVGREDDNIETIRKRFKVFLDSSLPVIEYYAAKGKVKKIDAAKPVQEVFEAVKTIFTPKDNKAKNA
ncbi:unnamed protein product, partial [Linum tenue]